MAMVDPSKWTGNWGSGVGRSGGLWSTNLNAVAATIGQKAAQSVGIWQSQVSTPVAAANYVKGTQNMNVQQFQATVSGAGQTKYTTSGTTKQAKYNAFANVAGSKWPSGLAALPVRGAAGSAENQQRMIQWSQYLISTKGSY